MNKKTYLYIVSTIGLGLAGYYSLTVESDRVAGLLQNLALVFGAVVAFALLDGMYHWVKG
jgi:hypothetical protein